ncbi:TetR/AcrR family transcriptional regulator C-terminal domain-containing protein [Stomatobaculum longum]|uniref:TetR/AcrR family transcriptional regulator C-terminal domain-containing protein n=1 Tax=Stomatobaculum longum TaxID=796942 RepID=UPI0028DB0159|nr:TetR/AcrR family transcriptional regulator C-terminal domain-containing protein [Stomatobaculum longum]
MKNEEMSTQTRNSLAVALKKRMETTEFSKIRVSDLLKDCNIVRSTFYYYFSDIYELLEWMLNTELIGLLEKCDELYTWDQGITMLMEYVRDNSKMCLCAFHSIGRGSLEKMFYKNCYVLMERFVNTGFSNVEVASEDKAFIMDFYVRAYVSALAAWLVGGMKKNPQAMVDMIERTVSGGIEDAFKRSAASRKS